jgi:anti-sigma B factor antagonist
VSVENKGGELKLLGLTETLRELFTVTRLLNVFDIYEDEAEALARFTAHDQTVGKPALAFV